VATGGVYGGVYCRWVWLCLLEVATAEYAVDFYVYI